MKIHGVEVKGAIDKETRCKHYHTEKDCVAIKFYCCNEFFSCYFCHKELGCRNEAVWPFEQFNEKAILCGSCGERLSIEQYLQHHESCPNCNAAFNPGCNTHSHLYFKTK